MTTQKMQDIVANYFDCTPNMSKLDRHIFFPVFETKQPFILVQPENCDIFKMSDCQKINIVDIDNIVYDKIKIFILTNYFVLLDFFNKKISFSDMTQKLK